MHILRDSWCYELDYKRLRIRMFSTASEYMSRVCQITELKWHGIVEAQSGVIGEIISVWNFC